MLRVDPSLQVAFSRVFLALEDKNVHCVAIKGTFDDCQDIVKERFGPVFQALGHGTRRF